MENKGRNNQGHPDVLWIDEANLAVVIDDVFEGDGIKYIRADHIREVTKKVTDKAIKAQTRKGYEIAPNVKVPMSQEQIIAYQDHIGTAMDKECEEALAIVDIMLNDKKRAHIIKDEPFDSLIKEICETSGYGATIDSACRQWYLKDPVGSKIGATCPSLIETIRKALTRPQIDWEGMKWENPKDDNHGYIAAKTRGRNEVLDDIKNLWRASDG